MRCRAGRGGHGIGARRARRAGRADRRSPSLRAVAGPSKQNCRFCRSGRVIAVVAPALPLPAHPHTSALWRLAATRPAPFLFDRGRRRRASARASEGAGAAPAGCALGGRSRHRRDLSASWRTVRHGCRCLACSIVAYCTPWASLPFSIVAYCTPRWGGKPVPRGTSCIGPLAAQIFGEERRAYGLRAFRRPFISECRAKSSMGKSVWNPGRLPSESADK